eukprot:553584_1
MLQHCPYNDWTAPFLSYAVSLGIFIPLQILLSINTLKYECSRTEKHSIKKSLNYSFIALIIVGLYWFIVDLLRFVIDPHLLLLQNNNILCMIVAYSPKMIPFVYFTLVFHQLIYRLETSFRGSFLSLSKTSRICIYLITYVPAVFILPPLFFAFLPSPCSHIWTPSDFKHWNNTNSFAFCDVRMHDVNFAIMIIGIVWVAFDNIFICSIFTWKLKRVLSLNDVNNRYNSSLHLFKLKTVIVKNCLLTVLASVSTIINWFLWWLLATKQELGGTFLYVDTFLNCFFIGLMFSYNDMYYKTLCKCCIKCCFQRCDKSINEDNQEQRSTQLHLYLNNSDYHKYVQFF